MNIWAAQIRTITESADDMARIAAVPNNGQRIRMLAGLEAEKKILQIIGNIGPVFIAQIMDESGLCETAVRQHITTLVAKGKIKRIGASRPHQWVKTRIEQEKAA